MEVGKKSIHEPVFVVDWINREFKPDNSTPLEKFKTHHPFSMRGANMLLSGSAEQVTFFGFPIENAYANYRGGDKYELYILLHLEDMNKILSFVEQIGPPENWNNEEIAANEFDILCWFFNDVYVTLGRSHLSHENESIPFDKRRSLYNVCITNAKDGELPGPEPISW